MKKIILAGLILLLFGYGQCLAELVTIGLTGTLRDVYDPDGLLGLSIGTPVTGSYTYDLETPDSVPGDSGLGVYEHYNSPCGMILTVGGLSFQTDENNVKFRVEILNNWISSRDGYLIDSYNNLQVLSGVFVDRMRWQLDDYTQTALDSDALPSEAPNLEDWDPWYMHITGGADFNGSRYDKPFSLDIEVDSVWVIPEPATVLLFAFGGLFLRKRR